MNLPEELKKIIAGDVESSDEIREKYSHDASLFEVVPEVVVFPKNTQDVQAVVNFVREHKKDIPNLSITARSAGTCMSGGSINESIIMDFTRYINKVIEVTDTYAVVEPGCYYRDFEKETLKHERIMPAYTASREICAVGGMVANNSAGEKTIKYGKVEQYVEKLEVVFTDGNIYEVSKLTAGELEIKCAQENFEGGLYKNLKKLIDDNYDAIMSAKPDVSKNSAGYFLWNVYDKKTGTFDLCRLLVGSQGTLGIVTKITFKIIPTEKYTSLLAVFLPDLKNLGNIVAEIVPFNPESIESYDDYSMKLAVRFFFDFFKQMGFWGAMRLGFSFLPETGMLITGGVPKLILLVECGGQDEAEVKKQLGAIKDKVTHYGYKMRVAKNSQEAQKYWKIRRESFNMLRKHVQGKRTAPFIDDIIVKPEYLPDFLPKIEAILKEHKLIYTIAGHAGNGNFHIIPLMDLETPFGADQILEISGKVYDLVLSYKGSITAEHNDGLVRTPYLEQMYGPEVYALFTQTKKIFDPINIFNPGKKVALGAGLAGTKEYLHNHIVRKKK